MRRTEPWTPEQTAALRSLIAVRLHFPSATAEMNARFGTNRTRKSCSSHIYELDERPTCGPRASWHPEHDEMLLRLVADDVAFAKIAARINATFGTSYTKNSCIGRNLRLKIGPVRPPSSGLPYRARIAAAVARRREKRWAEKPSLKAKFDRAQEAKKNRVAFVARGAPKTSAIVRAHMPKLPANMTRGELRAMLTAAVQNTAAMGVGT